MTAQQHERLWLNDRKMSIAGELEIPKHPRITKVRTNWMNTSCWRNYVGTWRITEDKLYLVDVQGCFALQGGEALFADWYSGTLRVPDGPLLQYQHSGYASTYACELFLEIRNGVVVSQRRVDSQL